MLFFKKYRYAQYTNWLVNNLKWDICCSLLIPSDCTVHISSLLNSYNESRIKKRYVSFELKKVEKILIHSQYRYSYSTVKGAR